MLQEKLLDEKLMQLEQARNWSPRVISKLEAFVRTGADEDLFRINPLLYAAEKGLSEVEALDLFLFGAKYGLFDIEWQVICCICGHLVRHLTELAHVHPSYICPVCQLKGEAFLDDFIQVSFTVSAKVRDLRFHHPYDLPLEEYLYHYNFAKGVLPINGMPYHDVLRFITQHLSFLEPKARQRVNLQLDQGLCQIKEMYHFESATLFLGENELSEVQNIPYYLADGELHTASHTLVSEVPFQRQAYDFIMDKSLKVDKGNLSIEVENRMDQRVPLWVIFYPQAFLDSPATPLEFAPFLSGKRLLTHQTFRDLFRSETIATSEEIGIRDITFLFTDLKGSTALYDRIGDAQAFYLVRQHFDTLQRIVCEHEGAIVKTIGDAIMACFMTPLQATQAALAMVAGMKDLNKGLSEELILKIGIHKGHSIAVTLNERVDYFGQTVNVAARVQGLAEANEICLSEEVYAFDGVTEAIEPHQVKAEQVEVKGVRGQLKIYRLAP